MSEWRAHIFVPDSEDELDSCSSAESLSSLDSVFPESQEKDGRSRKPIDDKISNVADVAGSAIAKGIEEAEGQRRQTQLQNDNLSEDELAIIAVGGQDNITRTTSNQTVEVVIVNERREPDTVEIGSSPWYGRTFRKRNPIQLHPYLLEGEKYRRTLKSRGIKPVALIQESQGQSAESQNAGEQFEDGDSGNDFDQDQADSASIRSSQPINHSAPTPSTQLTHQVIMYDTDDDLPDVETIFNRNILGGVQNGYKRRKTYQHRNPKKRLSSSESHPRPLQKSPLNGETETVYDLPPSPQSPSSNPGQFSPLYRKRLSKDFRMPRTLTPKLLPTPVTSSEIKPQSHRIPSSSPDSDIPSTNYIKGHRINPSKGTRALYISSDSSSSPEDRDDSQIRRIQKKMKGVLPASWLKLDQHTKTAKISRNGIANISRQDDFDDVTSPQRGVAQKIIRPRSSGNNEFNFHYNDSDEEAVGNTVADVEPVVLHSHPLGTTEHENLLIDAMDNTENIVDGEADEEDFIDSMVPVKSRENWKRRRSNFGQTTIEESMRVQARKPITKSVSYTKAAQSSARNIQRRLTSSKPPLKPRKKRINPPTIGILDVQERTWRSGDAPQFIRVAARQARQLSGYGRQKIESKHIRLQTKTDTADAAETLAGWKSGKYKRIMVSSGRRKENFGSERTRRPLQLRSGSEQNRNQPIVENIGSHRNLSLGAKKMQLKSAQLRQSSNTSRHEIGDPNQTNDKPNSNKNGSYMSASILGNRQEARSAQLEDLETNFNDQHPESAFRRNLSLINEVYRRNNDAGSDFIIYQPDEIANDNADSQPLETSKHATPTALRKSDAAKKQRKRPAKRLEITSEEYNQFQTENIEITSSPVTEELPTGGTEILGLGPYGTSYSTNFDMRPFDPGFYLHDSGVVGSGLFQQALRVLDRDLNYEPSVLRTACSEEYQQPPWNEKIVEELQVLSSEINDVVSCCFSLSSTIEDQQRQSGLSGTFAEITEKLQVKLQYISRRLWFSDPVDRQSFCSKMLEFVNQSCCTLISYLRSPDRQLVPAVHKLSLAKLMSYILVLSWQWLAIAQGDAVDSAIRSRVSYLFSDISKVALLFVIDNGISDLKQYALAMGQTSNNGLKTEHVELVIILFHILDKSGPAKTSLWDVTADVLTPRIALTNDISILEAIWSAFFTLLPFADFDSAGYISSNNTERKHIDNGSIVKELLSKVFRLYSTATTDKIGIFNDYVRATLGRSLTLINAWGFRHSEQVINCIFDFFASRGLASLRRETTSGSPRFLDDLSSGTSLELEPGDRAFHVFLKIMASGLLGMRHVYSKKRIGGIVWRYIPNHGRTYRKDQQIRHEDIEALRNHHDLLCVLFWASPPGFRPRISLIRSLVDFSVSHREACRLNVRAWSVLAKFQLSTEEDRSEVDLFAAWFKDILKQTFSQYHLARTEAQSDYDNATAQVKNMFTNEFLWSLVRENQNQILAYLSDAVRGLLNALKFTKNLDCAEQLIKKSGFLDIFGLLETRPSNLDNIFSESLLVVNQFLHISRVQKGNTQASANQDESQDYGDWPELEETESVQVQLDIMFLHDAVWQLLSNTFGSDIERSDKMLKDILETWSAIIARIVSSGRKSWSDYLEEQGTMSWSRLRRTENTRRFGPYFLMALLEQNSTIPVEHSTIFMSAWLVSLVERDALLKFQGSLTAALCRNNPSHPLLVNMPASAYWRHDGSLSMGSLDMRIFRISILSNVFENMRSSYEEVASYNFSELGNIQRQYSSMLKRIMNSMKANYQELQNGSDHKGAYVQLVQRIIELMQQYTSDMCPFDRFFTDPATFPQPAFDPTYIIGRLKSYNNKQADPRTLKKLAIFLQTITARAVAENDMTCLYDQLYSAMNLWEKGTPKKPTLRSVLMRGVLPSYLLVALEVGSGWIFAGPLLKASAAMFKEVFYNLAGKDSSCIRAITAILDDLLPVLCHSLNLLTQRLDKTIETQTLYALTLLAKLVTSVLGVIDYLDRQCALHSSLQSTISTIDEILQSVPNRLEGDECSRFQHPLVAYREQASFRDLRSFCQRELRQFLTQNWIRRDGRYHVTSAGMSGEMVVPYGTVEEEKEQLLVAIKEYDEMYDRMERSSQSELIDNREAILICSLVV